jgi:hypothetical protein
MLRIIFVAFTIAVLLQPANAPQKAGVSVTPAMLKSLSARAIGPAIMGGRISDIAYDPQNPWTFYVATAHGGLMKTTDNGASFSSLTEKENIQSTGAVAVAPSNPKVVWLGTGEANDRNSAGWGTGVYRSTDGGSTWTHAGLDRSRSIARIVVHPKDPDIAYVAVVGDLWNPSPERGIYKTTDGGKTWKAMLQADAEKDKVGGGDAAPDAMVVRGRSGCVGRQGPRRNLPQHRRRRVVEEADVGSAPCDRPNRPLRVREEPEDRLRRRTER